ncbi:MAG TPA: hypothetical protein VGJ07_03485 [Rugosimonospora sp.]|jgi:hypothetical protein
MRRTWRVLVVAAAVAVLAVVPLSAASANASPTGAHATALGSVPFEVPGCC